MISKPMMDISVPEKEKATFECEVSRTNADVRWFKVQNYYLNLCLQPHPLILKVFSAFFHMFSCFYLMNLQDDAELKPGKNISIHSLGRKRTLVINKCTPEDGGTYVCRTADDNTSAKLAVNGNYVTCKQIYS